MPPVSFDYQSDRARDLVFAAQASQDTLPDAGSGRRFRFNTLQGIQVEEERLPSLESRKTGMSRASSQGRRLPTFRGDCSLIVNGYDELIEAVARKEWAADAVITQAAPAVGQITVSGNTVTFASGGLLAAGVRACKEHVYTAGLASDDLNRPLYAVAVTDTTITYADTIADVAVATDFSLTIKRHLINGTDHFAFAMEDIAENLDRSSIAHWMKPQQWDINITGRGEVTMSFIFRGIKHEIRTGNDSPYFTNPAEPAGDPLRAADARLILNGAFVDGLSSLSLSLRTGQTDPNTTSLTPEDINLGSSTLTGSLVLLDGQEATTALENSGLDVPQTIAVRIYGGGQLFTLAVPQVMLTQPQASAGGSDDFSTQTFAVEADEDLRGGAFDNTLMIISTDMAA